MNKAKRTVQKRDMLQSGGFRPKRKTTITKRELRTAMDMNPNTAPDAFAKSYKAHFGKREPAPPSPKTPGMSLRQLRARAMKFAGHLKGSNEKFYFNPATPIAGR